VVIAIIALLMAILMPALQQVKKQARAVACQSNLHQWGLIWMMYTNDNNGYLHQGPGGARDDRWQNALRPNYSREPKIRCCPAATKPRSEGNTGTSAAWGIFAVNTSYLQVGDYGSYGVNWWVCNTPSPPGIHYYPGAASLANNWRRADVKGAGYIPLFFDCGWYGCWPREIDEPPQYDGQPGSGDHTNDMVSSCINRHNGFINSLFLDWSVRKIGLKPLWALKWHRNFGTAGLWTRAGGVQPSDWPDWMRNFKDY